MTQTLRIATRGSALALAQANWARAELLKAAGADAIDLLVVKTKGDRLQESDFKPDRFTKEIFTKEIDEALLRGEADFAVHSCKDLPVKLAAGLKLAAVPLRQDPADVVVARTSGWSEQPPPDAVVHTSGARRKLQWLHQHPRTRVQALRGNIDTRLRLLRSLPEPSGLMLAMAGLKRLNPGLSGFYVETLDWMIPAPGQGALAIETRSDNSRALEWARLINHDPSARCVMAERSFLLGLGAGCGSPVGALAAIGQDSVLRLRGIWWKDEETAPLMGEARGLSSEAEEIGLRLARQFKTHEPA
jgi:hydroxymethylbilane synthase